VYREAIYWSLISLAGAAAGLAHFWIDVFGYGTPYIVETFLPVCAWMVLYCLAYRFAGPSKKRRWLPLLMAPFAIWPACGALLTLLAWKLHGFAP